jgi:sulfoxide reductase catalytic subunit YedY
MLIRVPKPWEIPSSEITSKDVYLDRRRFLRLAAQGTVAAGLTQHLTPTLAGERLSGVERTKYNSLNAGDEPTSYDSITSYNNYYDFSMDKEEVAKLAKDFVPRPWAVSIEGLCNKPVTIDVDELIEKYGLEERVYRFRCVETWSMVVPWVGFPLAKLVKDAEPTGRARFIQFNTLHDPERMPGQQRETLSWPYQEGLRLDEALHPLSFVAVGLYGEALPNQNGAPLRLVVPWKYGYKSIKAIVRIRFVERAPVNTWRKINNNEYGFYANVNPSVDHPRWSQARERRIGEFLRRKTQLFNGYESEVAYLYARMDLKRYF